MADHLTIAQRSENMRRIAGKNTKPEMQVRRGLHAKGIRFRLHPGRLPGRPDLLLPKWRVAVFVHGCFWHGHTCSAGRLPATRADFWSAKIAANQARDHRSIRLLIELGWRVLVIWECGLRRPADSGRTIDSAYKFITESAVGFAELSSSPTRPGPL
jgi:DNA mismatch endonuclease (patch repair protein)